MTELTWTVRYPEDAGAPVTSHQITALIVLAVLVPAISGSLEAMSPDCDAAMVIRRIDNNAAQRLALRDE